MGSKGPCWWPRCLTLHEVCLLPLPEDGVIVHIEIQSMNGCIRRV